MFSMFFPFFISYLQLWFFKGLHKRLKFIGRSGWAPAIPNESKWNLPMEKTLKWIWKWAMQFGTVCWTNCWIAANSNASLAPRHTVWTRSEPGPGKLPLNLCLKHARLNWARDECTWHGWQFRCDLNCSQCCARMNHSDFQTRKKGFATTACSKHEAMTSRHEVSENIVTAQLHAMWRLSLQRVGESIPNCFWKRNTNFNSSVFWTVLWHLSKKWPLIRQW